MVVTIELETVREPDYAVGLETREAMGTDKKGASRVRDDIEQEEEESRKATDTKIRDLEESDTGFRDGSILPSSRAVIDVDGLPAFGGPVGSGRRVSLDGQGVEDDEGRGRQRRSWDAGAAMRRRHREAMRREEEDAFGRQL